MKAQMVGRSIADHRAAPSAGRARGGRDAGRAGRDVVRRSLFARMRRRRHQAQQIDHAGREHREIDDDEGDQRGGDRGRRQRRGGFSRAQQSIDRERLASGLGGDPAREHGDEARGRHRDRKHVQQPGIVQRAAHAHQQAEQAERQHQQSHADHDPERPERDRAPAASFRAARCRGRPSAHPGECLRISEPSFGTSIA